MCPDLFFLFSVRISYPLWLQELARVRGLLKNRSDHVCNLEDALKKNAASRAAQQRPAEKENKTPP